MVLNSHVRTTHSSGDKYPCVHCGLECANKQMLGNHLRKKHPDLLNFKCKLCSKGFMVKTKLFLHMQVYHHNESESLDAGDGGSVT